MLSSWVSYLTTFLIILMSSLFLMNLGLEWSFLNLYSNLFSLKSSSSYFNLIPLVMVLSISIMVFYWSRYYMLGSSSLTLFLVILFSFVISMVLLILSSSLMMIFLGWEGLGITSFVLIIFYQNWSSFQGGLLTLLTNRIGDAILMICLSYWILQSSYLSLSKETSLLLAVIFLSLTLTKSAQIPFTSWLPAAMAAPTPVSSLVHSSTLVTAGVLLMIKYGSKSFLTNYLWITFGLMTLTVASTAALMESDSKKVVALSTLSQLGLMFIALSMGGYFICLFHLVAHAFAKANLFLMVGNLIHSSFSLQDSRLLGAGSQSLSFFFMMIISILSLSGVVFTSGFFSKDYILMSEFSGMNSMLSILLLMVIITMTLVYCLKFLMFNMSDQSIIKYHTTSVASYSSSLLLSVLSILMGFIFIKNLSLMSVSKLSGFYWSFLLLSTLLITLTKSALMTALFNSQIYLVKLLNQYSMMNSKMINWTMSNTLLEGSYLSSLFLTSGLTLFTRSLIFITILCLIILLF